jgi:hypothetical protein
MWPLAQSESTKKGHGRNEKGNLEGLADYQFEGEFAE